MTMDVVARKVRVSQEGNETEVPMHDWIEIGAIGASGPGTREVLYLQKHLIRSGTNRIQIQLAKKPQQAVIDPRHLLMDAEMSDNGLPLREGTPPGL